MDDNKSTKQEREFQQKISNIKIEYAPCMTVSIAVLRGRNISVSFLHDLVDVPDPQVYVLCEVAEGRNHFKTKIAKNQVNPEWNETFTFVLPENCPEAEVRVDLFEEDRYKYDPHLGSSTIHTDDLELDKPKLLTFNYGKHGELDVEMVKKWRTSPDFRLSLGLSNDELEYRRERKPKIKRAIEKFLGNDKAPKNLRETPTIALAITGGGYRAVATSCGAMEALAEAQLLDGLMYTASLSGSSWYIASSYFHRSMASLDTLIKHHDWLRKQMEESLLNYFFDISFFKRFKNYRDYKAENHQPVTFVDFYGLGLGEKFLDKAYIQATFSSLKPYIQAAEVPFPIISCAHVSDTLPMSEFCDEVEMSPFEVSIPAYGINVPTEKFNSRWGNGILLNDLPEPPLHYIMGTSGSAFAIMTHKLKDKQEIGEELSNYIESHLKASTISSPQTVTEKHSQPAAEERDNSVKENTLNTPDTSGTKNFASREDNWLESIKAKDESDCGSCVDPKSQNVGSRGYFLQRTAKVRNCALACRSLTKYRFNNEPLMTKSAKSSKIIRTMSVKKSKISLCDAAIGCNLASIHVMRPQRMVDILIVVDCSNYLTETSLQRQVFATVQNQVHDHGVKFPRISIEEISKDPFREVYIFEDEEDPHCPIVLWLTLANTKFKEQQNPHRRPGYPKPDAADSGKEKFNDFCIFPESSDFGTLRLSFSALNFDRLRELMRYNVLNNMRVVKEKIAKKVQQLRTRTTLVEGSV